MLFSGYKINSILMHIEIAFKKVFLVQCRIEMLAFSMHYQVSIGSVMVKTLDWCSEGKRIETGLREGKKSAAGCAIFS